MLIKLFATCDNKKFFYSVDVKNAQGQWIGICPICNKEKFSYDFQRKAGTCQNCQKIFLGLKYKKLSEEEMKPQQTFKLWDKEAKKPVEVEATFLSGDEWIVRCPFHDDEHPSLHINDAKKVYHCKGCNKSGKVLADDYQSQMIFEPVTQACVDWLKTLGKEYELKTLQDLNALQCSYKDVDCRLAFQVGKSPNAYIYYTKDLVNKRFKAKWLWWPKGVGKNQILGEIEKPNEPVRLFAGITDWIKAKEWNIPNAITFVAGESSIPEDAHKFLKDKIIHLIYDTDNSQQRITRICNRLITEAKASLIKVIDLKKARDLRGKDFFDFSKNHTIKEFYGLEAKPKQVTEGEKVKSNGIAEDDGQYFSINKKQIISNFVLEFEKIIELSDTEIIHAKIGNKQIIFSKHDFDSKSRFLSKLASTSLSFRGSENDLQSIMSYVRANSAYELFKGSRVMGLVDSEWVCPGKNEGIIYVAEDESDISVKYTNGKINPDIFIYLFGLNQPEIILPILGWFCSSVIKLKIMQVLNHFPQLYIYGEKGSGKSTTLSILMDLFGIKSKPLSCLGSEFRIIKNLACTNGIPVIFDNYKEDLLDKNRNFMTFLNILEEAYDGMIHSRGRPDQTLVHYPLIAPIVVSGEDNPAKRARQERGIPVLFTKILSQNMKDSLHKLQMLELSNFALPFIQFAIQYDFEPRLKEIKLEVEKTLPSVPWRIIDNLAIWILGLDMFYDFANTQTKNVLNLTNQVDEILKHQFELLYPSKFQKDDFDEFLETVAILINNKKLESENHYTIISDELCIHFASTYDLVRKYYKEVGYSECRDKQALLHIARKKNYIIKNKESNLTHAKRFRSKIKKAIVIDLRKIPQELDLGGINEEY